ncbi:hypothetical protein ACF0H5_015897 [Mactra antiquata]
MNGSPFPLSSPSGFLPSPSPSPGGKKIPGISNNARNNLYMKSLMNSPYHKSYTPFSATPGFSPVYQTPSRFKQDKHDTPNTGATSTPQGTRPPNGSKRYVTPKNIVNPFDCGHDDLHLPAYMSPGFFTVASTPASEDRKMFRWSIEHIAELNPADIDEMPVQQDYQVFPDKETEERAQRAIDQFFANNLIHPSPWSDPKKSKKNILPATPASYGKYKTEILTELQGSIQKTLPNNQSSVDVSCQTTLSLPVDFDLQKVLGSYMSQDINNDDNNQQDMLSTSSLRRKLFFHGDTSSLAPSPVKGMNIDEDKGSPMYKKHLQTEWERTTPLKNTPAFSSSPIRSAGSSIPRRCSSDPEFLASPELSPIIRDANRRPKTRSSGMFQPHGLDFDISPLHDDDQRSTGDSKHSRISPIPFPEMSPETIDDDIRPKFEDSPGFSPIRSTKTPIRKILRKSQEESYIQDDCYDSLEEGESVTPVSSNPKSTSIPLTPVDTISSIQQPNLQLSSAITKSQSINNLQHIAVDQETDINNPEYIMTSSLSETRDFSSISADYTDDTHLRASLSNQDTGYQTASLQSTNQESVSMHTNLTNQFGSLPFNLTNQDTSLLLSANQTKPPILNLNYHYSRIDDDTEPSENVVNNFNDNKNTSASVKQKLFFTDDQDDYENTPKNMKAPFVPMLNFEDSALPEDFSSSQGKLDIDVKDSIDSQEEDVLSRARQVLAMADSLYPQKVVIKQKATPDVSSETQPSASMHCEIAYSILQRAGQDLQKYGSILSKKKMTEITTGNHAGKL